VVRKKNGLENCIDLYILPFFYFYFFYVNIVTVSDPVAAFNSPHENIINE